MIRSVRFLVGVLFFMLVCGAVLAAIAGSMLVLNKVFKVTSPDKAFIGFVVVMLSALVCVAGASLTSGGDHWPWRDK